MPLVGARPIYRPPVSGEPLRLRDDGHWSTQGLVGYWPMREMRGTMTQDVGPYGNHGTLVNGPTWVAGERGTALSFDGSTQGGYIPDHPSLRPTTAITVAVCITPKASITGNDGCFQKDYANAKIAPYVSWGFEWESITTIRWFVASTGDTLNNRLTVNIDPGRNVLVGTYGPSGRQRVWVNNVLRADKAQAGTIAYYDETPVNIMAHLSPIRACAPGDIEWAGVWATEWGAKEVAALSAAPDLPIWRPRRGISLALVGGGAVLPMFGGYNLGKSLLRGANL